MRCTAYPTTLTRRTAGTMLLTGLLGALLLAGCAGGPGMAAYRQGDYSGAIREFRAEGDPDGDFAVGVMHYKGEGVARDAGEAAGWFRRAAENGHAGARYNLGLLYLNGEGVTRDRREAARWFRLAADQGYVKAQLNLGLMYAQGDGVDKDRREAVRWFRQAAGEATARRFDNSKEKGSAASAVACFLRDMVTLRRGLEMTQPSSDRSPETPTVQPAVQPSQRMKFAGNSGGQQNASGSASRRNSLIRRPSQIYVDADTE